MNVPNVPPPWTIAFPTLLINSRPRIPYLWNNKKRNNSKSFERFFWYCSWSKKCAFHGVLCAFARKLFLFASHNPQSMWKKNSPKSTKTSKQCTACHPNAEANRKTVFHFWKATRLLVCSIHTPWHRRHFRLFLLSIAVFVSAPAHTYSISFGFSLVFKCWTYDSDILFPLSARQ